LSKIGVNADTMKREALKILAIIPARGGSQGVLRKNIRILAGRPLIAYTIKAALGSTYHPRVIVSTDDRRIAEIAKGLGAEIPFIRPPQLAQNNTPMLPVIQHTIGYLKRDGYIPDIIAILQPTSPLRTSEHIDQAISLLLDTGADSVVSLCEAEHSPYWMKKIDEAGRVIPFLDTGEEYHRRQDLPKVYRLNGAIFITRSDIIMKENRLLGDDTRAYIMKPEDSIDIDTELDFKIAELIMKERTSPACEGGSCDE